MTFLNNFLLTKCFRSLFRGVWEHVRPSLWFQYELLTPLELGERSMLVKISNLRKRRICMCCKCPMLFHLITANFIIVSRLTSLSFHDFIVISYARHHYCHVIYNVIQCPVPVVFRFSLCTDAPLWRP